ncbi:MAG: prolipoprotein diacylglyceryl transferase [Alphaproteobacteria bacterium]|nr:prolipoprotein diacylglyceryl transferase [Alphaproteobacteria bacterium]
MLAAIQYPSFNPVAIDLGFFQIRWYALAYIGGLLLGWWYLNRLLDTKWWPDGPPLSKKEAEDLVFWAMLGVVIGGRLGYVLFYKPSEYFSHPLEILQVWNGGMSFHGGLLGVVTVIIAYALINKRSMFHIGDLVGCVVPIGLMLGRIANFINGELYGRITGSDWGMIFPQAGPEPRYPSQLIEATLEGLVLLIVLRLLFTRTSLRFRPGTLCGCFLIGYGLARIVSEFFREPDAYLGYLWFHASMGQLLSIPMLLVGAWLIIRARRTAPSHARTA